MSKYVTRYDFRNAKTEENIKRAFLDLSLENKTATVSDICLKLGINRSTFYRHFEDIYYLMNELKGDLLMEMESLFSALIIPDTYDECGVLKRSAVMRILHACLNKKDEILVFMDSSVDPEFRNDLIDVITSIIEEVYAKYSWKNEKYRSYSALRLASGTITMIIKWLKDQNMSIEAFCKLFMAVIYNAIDLTKRIYDLE